MVLTTIRQHATHWLTETFYTDGKPDRLLVGIFSIMHFVMLVNVFIHNPKMTYDGAAYNSYIVLFFKGWPTPETTREFFSAPLPFVLPAAVYSTCDKAITLMDTWVKCTMYHGKVGQTLNLLFSMLIVIFALKIADRIFPANRNYKVGVLALFGILTLHYKTFAMLRAEPYLAVFSMAATYLVLRMFERRQEIDWKDGVLFGVVIGGLTLSRQWGFLSIPALFAIVLLAFWIDKKFGMRLFKVFAIAGVIAFFISGWWYIHLYIDYESFSAFNMKGAGGFSFSNQPLPFYRGIGIEHGLLFTAPTPRTFDNMFIPIMYSEMWGDYWGFFTYVRDLSYLGEMGYGNKASITPYLGRVNLVSLFPSAIFLIGFIMGMPKLWKGFRARQNMGNEGYFFIFISTLMASIFFGYLWFLIAYPDLPQGRTIKATYIIQLVHLLPFFGALFLSKLAERSPRLHRVFLFILGLVFLHNLPAMISRYVTGNFANLWY